MDLLGRRRFGGSGVTAAVVVAVGRCWLRSCCVPCSRQFFKGVIQFLDKGFDVVEVVQIIPQECIQLCIAGQICRSCAAGRGGVSVIPQVRVPSASWSSFSTFLAAGRGGDP